jgi:hypothetical protein
MKYAMAINQTAALGKQLAIAGFTAQQVVQHVVSLGYKHNSITIARVMLAYNSNN